MPRHTIASTGKPTSAASAQSSEFTPPPGASWQRPQQLRHGGRARQGKSDGCRQGELGVAATPSEEEVAGESHSAYHCEPEKQPRSQPAHAARLLASALAVLHRALRASSYAARSWPLLCVQHGPISLSYGLEGSVGREYPGDVLVSRPRKLQSLLGLPRAHEAFSPARSSSTSASFGRPISPGWKSADR